MDSEILSSGVKSHSFISPSSPPPISENILSDDEEFGNFAANGEDSFDITGLSQKLPPSEALCNIPIPTDKIASSEALSDYSLNLRHFDEREKDSKKLDISFAQSNDQNKDGSTSISDNSRLMSPPPLDCIVSTSSETLDTKQLSGICEEVEEFTYEEHQNQLSHYETTPDDDQLSNSSSHQGYIIENKIISEDLSNSTSENKLEVSESSNSINLSTNSPVDDENNDVLFTGHNKEETGVEKVTQTEMTDNDYSLDKNNDPESILPDPSDDNSDSSKDKEDYLNKIITCHQSLQENFADDDSDFGDFADFESNKIVHPVIHDINNDFADASEEENSELENEIRSKIDQAINDDEDINDDDEFGDFTSTANFSESVVPEQNKWPDTDTEEFAEFETAFPLPTNVAKTEDSYQFDSLILRWVPFEPCFVENEDNGEKKRIETLEDIIEGDAFIWHHLQDIDSSLALKFSWASTYSNKLFSSALNVDARNIVSKDSMLMGNSWSSSVPAFAQTLSFSPLTPVKPVTEASSSTKSWTKPVSKPEVPSSSSFKHSYSPPPLPISQPQPTNKEIEPKVIPPVTFDWSSSGLTNPLDGPGCFSSLLDYQSLATESKVAIGATCSALSNLEKEMLNNSSNLPPVSSQQRVPATQAPFIQKILEAKGSSIENPTPKTSIDSLSENVQNIIKEIPNLNFMRSKVLMFPIRDDTGT